MPRTDLLRPLDDIAYCCECVAQDVMGELKTELSRLCEQIRTQAPGYEAQEVQAALPRLDSALESFRSGRDGHRLGTNLLSSVSRAWWSVVKY